MGNNLVNGDARIPLRQGDFPTVLRITAQKYETDELLRIIADPWILASQTPSWVEKNRKYFSDYYLHNIWEKAVVSQYPLVGRQILDYLQKVTEKNHLQKIQLKIMVAGNQIFLNQCPFCRRKNVLISRLNPEVFSANYDTATATLQRLFFRKPCEHAIPIDDTIWQIIQNVIALNKLPRE